MEQPIFNTQKSMSKSISVFTIDGNDLIIAKDFSNQEEWLGILETLNDIKSEIVPDVKLTHRIVIIDFDRSFEVEFPANIAIMLINVWKNETIAQQNADRFKELEDRIYDFNAGYKNALYILIEENSSSVDVHRKKRRCVEHWCDNTGYMFKEESNKFKLIPPVSAGEA